LSSPRPFARSPRPLVFAAIAALGVAELYVAWLALHPHVSANYRAYYIDQTTTCLDKPISGAYRLGSTVSFLPDDQPGARKLRVCGWDGPAGDGTHSVGTTARLRFAVPGSTGELALRLYLTAISAPDHPQQHIVLTAANGTPIGEATIPADVTENLDFTVPASANDRSKGLLDVIIAFPTAAEMTPRDSDTHFRAIKLLSVQLRRPGGPPSAGPQDDPVAIRHHAPPA
jgi:hypothetical protein